MNRTGTERKRNTGGHTLMYTNQANPLNSLEAGSGIEPLYTDLQSAA